MVPDGILNNNASDEKESPLVRNRRVTSSFGLAETAAFMTVFVLDIQGVTGGRDKTSGECSLC